MTCPRRYQYEMVEGWRGSGIDLEFGQMFHSSLEEFDRSIARGEARETATDLAVKHALSLSASIDDEGKLTYWRGQYLAVWKCSDSATRINGKGKEVRNVKRCELAKNWIVGDMSMEHCSACGKANEHEVHWFPEDNKKDRYALIRSIIEFCDTAPDSIRPVVFPNGRVAVELSFQLPLDILTPDGEPYLLTGNLDGIASLFDDWYTRERKTTKTTLGGKYFQRFSPDIQIDTYDVASYLAFPDRKIKGTLIEATQTAANFSRVGRHFVTINQELREENFDDIRYWIKRAEADARSGTYHKNTAACHAHGGCPFMGICRIDPSQRQPFLTSNYQKSFWNPLEIRGESAYIVHDVVPAKE